MRSHARRTGQPLTTLAGAVVAGGVAGAALQQAAASFEDQRAT
jgi:outer membrane lipoprotein SlyB